MPRSTGRCRWSPQCCRMTLQPCPQWREVSTAPAAAPWASAPDLPAFGLSPCSRKLYSSWGNVSSCDSKSPSAARVHVSHRLLRQMGVCRAAVFIGARDFSPSSLEFSGLKVPCSERFEPPHKSPSLYKFCGRLNLHAVK